MVFSAVSNILEMVEPMRKCKDATTYEMVAELLARLHNRDERFLNCSMRMLRALRNAVINEMDRRVLKNVGKDSHAVK